MHIVNLHPSPGEPGTLEGLGPANHHFVSPPDESDAKTGAPLLWATLTTHWDYMGALKIPDACAARASDLVDQDVALESVFSKSSLGDSNMQWGLKITVTDQTNMSPVPSISWQHSSTEAHTSPQAVLLNYPSCQSFVPYLWTRLCFFLSQHFDFVLAISLKNKFYCFHCNYTLSGFKILSAFVVINCEGLIMFS